MMNKKKKVPAAVYSRVVGYWSEVRNWNVGKRQEFADRKDYEVPKEMDYEPKTKGS